MAEPKILKEDKNTYGLYKMYNTILKETLAIPTYNDKDRKIEKPKDAEKKIYEAVKKGLSEMGLKVTGDDADAFMLTQTLVPFVGLEDIITKPQELAMNLAGSIISSEAPIARNVAALGEENKISAYAKKLGYDIKKD